MNPKAAKHIQAAQMEVLSHALVGFVEQILGRCPTDDEVLKLGQHVMFVSSKTTTFTVDGIRFNRFYVWANEHVLALRFNNPKDPLTLSICEVRREDWPAPLAKMLADKIAKESGE